MTRRVQDWEQRFDFCNQALNMPDAVPEYRFHPVRRWRFDRAYPAYRVSVEVNGGAWTNGRHTRGGGYIGDLEKLNAAQVAGWLVLQFTPAQVMDDTCWGDIQAALTARGWRSS